MPPVLPCDRSREETGGMARAKAVATECYTYTVVFEPELALQAHCF